MTRAYLTLDGIEGRSEEYGSERGRPYRDNREPSTRRVPLHLGGCWCGLPIDHDWPGMGEGAPHPREESSRD